MIVRTEHNNTYFLILDHVYTEDQWLSAASVHPGSPAANLAARMYSCFFCGTTDVIDEFKKYYEPEYRSFWMFLYWHYMINEDVIEQIKGIYKPPQRLLYGDVHSGGDYGVGDYAMAEDEGFPVVQRIFKTLGRKQRP